MLAENFVGDAVPCQQSLGGFDPIFQPLTGGLLNDPKFKIGRRIIEPVAIAVVNVFPFAQRPAYHLRHDQPMLKFVARGRLNLAIAGLRDGAGPLLSALQRGLASVTAFLESRIVLHAIATRYASGFAAVNQTRRSARYALARPGVAEIAGLVETIVMELTNTFQFPLALAPFDAAMAAARWNRRHLKADAGVSSTETLGANNV